MFGQGLLITPIIISITGPEIFGTYVLLVTYLGVVIGVSSFGVGVIAKRRLPSTTNANERAKKFYPQFRFQMISIWALGLTSTLGYVCIIELGHSGLPNFPIWMLIAYLTAYTLYSQAADYFRYTHRIGVFNAATVAQPYLFIVLTYTAYKSTDTLNIKILLGSLIASCLFIAALLIIKIIREIGIQSPRLVKKHISNEIKIGLPLVLAYLVDVSLASGDRFIIAAILSTHDVGVYVPAYALGSLVLVIPKVLGVILPPLISRKVDSGDTEGARQLLEQAIKIFLWVSIPYAMGAAVLGKEILTLYAGAEVSAVAWMVVPTVALASLFYGLILIKSNILYVRMETSKLFKINLISAVINIGLNIALLNLFGNVVLAAVATLVSYCFSYLILSKALRSDEINALIDFGWIIKIVLSACGMVSVLLLSKVFTTDDGVAVVLISLIVGLGSYSLFSVLHPQNRKEIVELWNAFRQ